MSKLDDIDRRILRALQKDGSRSHASLATDVGASSASVWRRVKAMEDAGVLGANVRLVEPRAVDRGVNVMCQLRMKSHLTADRKAFEASLERMDEIVECYAMSGGWDYLMRVVVADVDAYQEFLMNRILSNPAVANATSHFALGRVKYTTALPV